MHKQYFELFPFHPMHDHIFIVEMPEQYCNRANAFKIIYADGWDMNEYDYHEHCFHNAIQSATARARGCEFIYQNHRLTYKEKQGDGPYAMKYLSYQDYKSATSLEMYSGGTARKVAFIDINTSIKILNRIGFKIEYKEGAPGFDGCVCRECNAGCHMAEPDGLKNDGKLTCYTCRERLKSYKQWPYKD